jgi:hypothetical protein
VVCRADLKHVSDIIQSRIERGFACVMDYGPCIGSMSRLQLPKLLGQFSA